MKRKFTFFGICVLVCTLMISLGSCQKDYSEDIDDLQEQINDVKGDIAALNQAIAQGKIITSVSNVTGGYEITFSDNSSITIEHGEDGADGADGADGETGADGFTPVIGVDEEGYWTVITTEGGDPVRIQDAGGNDVKAELDDEFGVTENGMLTIGGVETAVQIPVIAYNEETETLQITIKDEEGNFVTYSIPIAENAFSAADLTSVVSPIGFTNVLIGYGMVPEEGDPNEVPEEGLEWAGVEAGEQLRSGGILPVILNPAEVAFEDYDYTVINAKGEEYELQPDSVAAGYDGDFTQFQFVTAEGANGLFSLFFNPTQDELEDMDGEVTKELAVKVSKDDRDVISGYQYAIKVAQDTPLDYIIDPDELYSVDTLYIFSVIGEEFDVLPKYLTPDASGRALVPNDFFKAGVLADTLDANDVLQEFVAIDGTELSTEATAVVNDTLSDQVLKYYFRTMDWAGGYVQNTVKVVYWAQLDDEVEAYDPFTHVLDEVETTDTLSFDAVGDVIEAAGKGDIMVDNAINFKITIEDSEGNPVSTIDYEFVDENGDALEGPSGVFMNQVLASVADLDKVVFHFDETIVLPGEYIATVDFTDARIVDDSNPLTYPEYEEFTVEMPFTVENPVIDFGDITAKKANLFDGQNLVVYGSGSGSILQTNPANFFYDLHMAYKNFGPDVTAPLATLNEWMFVSPTTNPIAMLVDNLGTNKERFTFAEVENTVDVAEPNTKYPVELHYIYFGNPNNTDSLETIYVEARSEVYDGYGEEGTADIEITNGDVVNKVTLGATHYKVFDYLGNDLNIFAPTDSRVVDVTLEAPEDQAHLLNITPNGTTWDIMGTDEVAVINPTTIIIPLTLTVTDVLGLEKEYTINVTLTQP
jgi:hypothetical protein